MSCLTSGSAFSLMVTAAVVWGTKMMARPAVMECLEMAAVTRSVMLSIWERSLVRTLSCSKKCFIRHMVASGLWLGSVDEQHGEAPMPHEVERYADCSTSDSVRSHH